MKEKLYDVIKRPIITEKSMNMGEFGKYSFIVAKPADKNLVKKAIENLFEVKVTKVNILNVYGKTKRFRGRKGQQSGYKKAIVTLADGHTIDYAGSIK